MRKRERKITKMNGIKLESMEIKLTSRLEININRKDEKFTDFSINHSFF